MITSLAISVAFPISKSSSPAVDVGQHWCFDASGLVSLYTQHNMIPGNGQGELLRKVPIQLVQLPPFYRDSNTVLTVNQFSTRLDLLQVLNLDHCNSDSNGHVRSG